jgi:hypothetical protein
MVEMAAILSFIKMIILSFVYSLAVLVELAALSAIRDQQVTEEMEVFIMSRQRVV